MQEIRAVIQVRQRLTLRKAYEPERLLGLRAVPGHVSAGRVSSSRMGQFGQALEYWSESGKHSPRKFSNSHVTKSRTISLE